jgi:fumarate hydratase class II
MTTAPRVEHDSMGALDVPATALWGAQTQRAIQNFPPSGLRMPRAFVRALGLIKYAAAGANWELGDLGEPLALADPGRGARRGAMGATTISFRWTCSRPAPAPAAT